MLQSAHLLLLWLGLIPRPFMIAAKFFHFYPTLGTLRIYEKEDWKAKIPFFQFDQIKTYDRQGNLQDLGSVYC